MTSTATKLLEEALALPEEDRERLAEALFATLEREAPEDVARAWDEEVKRRLEAAERDESTARDWDDVYAELRAKHGRG